MALTTDQQSDLDFQLALATASAEREVTNDARRQTNQLEADAARAAQQAGLQAKQAKLEAVRLAKEVLIENARSKPVDSRDVSAAEITAFAETLVAYVNA
jgi:hypothetical protein